jgi:DNA-binding transcriptional MocR family regulator
MAADLRVTVATLTRAVSELTRRGVLVTRPGAGTFVASAQESSRSSGAVDGLIDLRTNVPPVEPVQHLLRDTLSRLEGAKELFEYEVLGGSPAARQTGADWLKLRGLSPTPEQVVVTNGAHEGMLVALRAITSPGDRVLCESLHYTGLRQIATLLKVQLVGVPIDGKGLDMETFVRLCKEISPRAAVLTPVTHMPTTTTLSMAARKAIATAARQAEMFLVEDDIFGHFAGGEEPTLASLAPDRTVLITSLSKCIAPGMRIGHLFAPLPLMEAVERAQSELGWTCPALYSAIARHLITDGIAELCIKEQQAEALERARLAREYLGTSIAIADEGSNQPRPSYHGWLTLPPGRQADRFVTELAARQVLASPAYHFAQTDLPAPEAVRIALGDTSRERVVIALQRVASVLKQAGPGATLV